MEVFATHRPISQTSKKIVIESCYLKGIKFRGNTKFYAIPVFRLLHPPRVNGITLAASLALFFTPGMDSMRLEHLEV